MLPYCGYDPGLAAYLSSVDGKDQPGVVDMEPMDRRLSLICLALVALSCGFLWAVA